ncbi:Yip1 family protein [Novosphingobium sp.]|uniref:Yip1 family protein n=1 Tax=Novosphingobium sp. TaxID=1874826 RepID=UPI0035B448E5
MNDSSTPSGNSGLIDRAKAITLNPAETWPVIAAEPSSPGEIITRYAIPLAAIGPVALFIGGQLFGISMMIATYHPSLMSGLSMALTSFVMSIVSLIVVALLADFLAPNFEGTANRTQAFKLVAYAMTPGWIAGILGIMPSLMMLGVLAGLYGLYLFYLGAGPVMKVPQAKAAVYTVITAICAIVLMTIAGSITQRVGNMFGGGAAGMMSGNAGDNVEVNIPGVGKIDTANIEKATKDLENAQNAKPVELSALQALLPAALGGYNRTAVESTGAGAMGAQAEGTYTSGDKTIRLRVVDMAAMGAVAGIMGGLGVEQNREDANGYERTTTKDGRLTIEKWDRSSNSGSYATQVAGRFLVEAEGEANSVDELKSAVASIDASKLEGLAK